MTTPLPQAVAQRLAVAARHLKAARPGEAIGPLREAAALAPRHATIQHDLGLAALEIGHLPEALAAFQAAIAINPRFTDAHFRMGITLEKLNQAGQAVAAFDRTTELLPGHTEAWFRAGALVFTLGHREAAIACFRRAAATGPKTSFGRLGAARALLAQERDPEAEIVLRRALALDRYNAMALDLLGHLLADSGRFDEARQCFAAAIAHAPLMAGSYYDLVRCGRVTAADADLPARMQAALATPGLESHQRLRVHLALGKAADDLDDTAAAMRHFDAADAERRTTSVFDNAAFDRQIDRLIAIFTPELVARAPTLGLGDTTPLLIVGLPRSGTTLVEQILSCHPDVSAGGELNFWNERAAAWERQGSASPSADYLRAAGADYLRILRAIGPSAGRVTDKMPFNFLWAGLIHLAFPHATILHCRRRAIDTALSIHQTHFNAQLAFPTGGSALVAYIGGYQRLMAHWRRVLPADKFIELDYETLTDTPQTEIRRIVKACGLGWNDTCLHPEHNARVVKTASKWQARQPIYQDAVPRWRRYEAVLGELGALMGSK
jgi:tetratricopeptide (TPR) repeat protein